LNVPGAKTASSRGSTDENVQKIVDRAVSAATKRQRDTSSGGGGGGGGQRGGQAKKRNRKRRGNPHQPSTVLDDSDSGSDDGSSAAPKKRAPKKPGAGKTTNQLTNRMHIPTWRTKYGSKMVSGKDVSLCWHHLHKKDGCVLPDGKEFFHSHGHFPSDLRRQGFW
jgi:hypothetical protein